MQRTRVCFFLRAKLGFLRLITSFKGNRKGKYVVAVFLTKDMSSSLFNESHCKYIMAPVKGPQAKKQKPSILSTSYVTESCLYTVIALKQSG